jgi:hypothetical protein
MEKYIPILKEPKIIENCSTSLFLKGLKREIENSKGWNFLYPLEADIEHKFPKLTITTQDTQFLLGLCFSLLIQIYEKGGSEYFNLDINFCGASIKDKNTYLNPHTDHSDNELPFPVLKVLGILNFDWDPKLGGNFIWGDKEYPLLFNNFLIFDPQVIHSNSPILCNKKRIAIDFTVPAKI